MFIICSACILYELITWLCQFLRLFHCSKHKSRIIFLVRLKALSCFFNGSFRHQIYSSFFFRKLSTMMYLITNHIYILNYQPYIYGSIHNCLFIVLENVCPFLFGREWVCTPVCLVGVMFSHRKWIYLICSWVTLFYYI